MSDYKNNWPPIDEQLVERLDEMFPITDGDLEASEWDRAYLAGQRSVVAKIKGIKTIQTNRANKGAHVRK